LWFGEPSKDIEVVGVGRELKEESDIVHCPSSCATTVLQLCYN
jgi:hypothetical protein